MPAKKKVLCKSKFKGSRCERELGHKGDHKSGGIVWKPHPYVRKV
jgi:hypothetical protein